MSALFLSHEQIRDIEARAELVRVRIRKAARFTTKSESPRGMEAHRALHEAEVEVDKILRLLAGN